jgi:hypothetical protein
VSFMSIITANVVFEPMRLCGACPQRQGHGF